MTGFFDLIDIVINLQLEIYFLDIGIHFLRSTLLGNHCCLSSVKLENQLLLEKR